MACETAVSVDNQDPDRLTAPKTFRITIIGARNLPKKWLSSPDYSVMIQPQRIGSSEIKRAGVKSWKQTKIIKSEINPVWDEQVVHFVCMCAFLYLSFIAFVQGTAQLLFASRE